MNTLTLIHKNRTEDQADLSTVRAIELVIDNKRVMLKIELDGSLTIAGEGVTIQLTPNAANSINLAFKR